MLHDTLLTALWRKPCSTSTRGKSPPSRRIRWAPLLPFSCCCRSHSPWSCSHSASRSSERPAASATPRGHSSLSRSFLRARAHACGLGPGRLPACQPALLPPPCQCSLARRGIADTFRSRLHCLPAGWLPGCMAGHLVKPIERQEASTVPKLVEPSSDHIA